MNITTTVYVTSDDIRRGEPGECDSCPIALAIDKAAEAVSSPAEYVHAQVFTEKTWLHIGKNRYQASLPQSARDFIGRYDNALPVEPFEFTLRWEDES